MENETKVVPRYGNRGVVACQLIEAMKGMQIGDIMTAPQLHEKCGHGVRPGQDGYPGLLSARNYLLNEEGMVVKWQTGQDCMKRLNGEESLREADAQRKHIHRSAKRSMRTVASVNPNDVNGQVDELRAKLAMMGTIAMFSTASSVKRLKNERVSQAIDKTRLLDVFK